MTAGTGASQISSRLGGPQSTLRVRLAWITGLRLAFLLLLLGAITFFYLQGDLRRYPTSQTILLTTVGLGFACAVGYALVLRSGKGLVPLSYAQIAIDQITWTAFVYVSGGTTSGATSFYGLSCLVGAILVGRRGALVAAIIGYGIYGLLTAGYVAGVLHAPDAPLQRAFPVELSAIGYPILVNALGIGVVAMLAGYLAERLRLTGGALVVATKRVEEAERLAMLGRLSAGLAHEIRNPLGSIAGSIEMLKESPALDEEDRRLCEIIQREAARLNMLVGDMVDLSKPRPPQPQNVDVAELARDVVRLASQAERSASDVTVIYEGPSGAEFAYCDGAQIRQVLWNLVRNGVQATTAGSKVVVRLTVDETSLRLAVIDGGPGIPEDQRARVFEAFYTTRSRGTGIGLAVVKRIVDEHARYGASIEVGAPLSGGGACFEVTLERRSAASRNDDAARNEA